MIELDDLTQLPSRKGWLLAAQNAVDAVNNIEIVPKGLSKAVLFIDLDRFKWVNDSLGHEAGDSLLKQVARLIESVVCQQGALPDIVGRLGGDEFVVLLQSPESVACLNDLAAQIVECLSQPIVLEKHNTMNGTESIEVEIGASIGISRYPRDGASIASLLKFADLAMYRAKHSGRNQVVVYQPEMMRQIERRREIQSALRQALKDSVLELKFMPVYDGKTQSIIAVDVELEVARSPLLSSLDKGELFSIADESQIALHLSEWMIQTALAFNQRLVASGVEVAFVLEVRPSHFHQKRFVSWLEAQLECYEIPPELLVLSLNEACLNAQRFAVASQLQALSTLGVEIAVQSFGSGNWSLLRLHDWPIDRLHLSAILLQEMSNSRTMEAMTGALIQLGQTLNKKVVAYGVSTAEQLAFVNSHHCYLIQGSLLSEPLSEAQLEADLLKGLVGDYRSCSPYYNNFSAIEIIEDDVCPI